MEKRNTNNGNILFLKLNDCSVTNKTFLSMQNFPITDVIVVVVQFGDYLMFREI